MTGPAGSAPRYRLAADTLGEAEIAAAKSVLDSGQLTMGAQVRAFETAFAQWVGSEHAVMVNSGSSANLLISDALLRGTSTSEHLLPGDEVIVPGLSWPTTVWPLAQLGLVPVFVDVDPVTLAIDLDSAESVIGPRTRAMFLIHPLGRAVDLAKYRDFCDANRLQLIEDCCESLGAHSAGAHVGTVGMAGSFSFYFSHHISTVEGGMVITNDPSLADDIRGLRAHGWIRDRSDRDHWIGAHPELDPRFLFATVGYNVRPTEIQAAMGVVQLERLDEMLLARETLARRVKVLLEPVEWLDLIGAESLHVGPASVADRRARTHSWMTLPMRVSRGSPVDRRALVEYFETGGVETRPLIAGNLARHPATAHVVHRTANDLADCDSLLRETLMIGCHPVLLPETLETLEQTLIGLRDL